MPIRPMGAELIQTEGRKVGWVDPQTGRHDRANTRSLHFFERACQNVGVCYS